VTATVRCRNAANGRVVGLIVKAQATVRCVTVNVWPATVRVRALCPCSPGW